MGILSHFWVKIFKGFLMKKRLKKKRHLGEYQELGFKIVVKHESVLSEEEIDMVHDFFMDLCEHNGCFLGWGITIHNESSFIIELGRRGDSLLSDFEDKRDILMYQINHFVIKKENIYFGEIKDLWYEEV